MTEAQVREVLGPPRFFDIAPTISVEKPAGPPLEGVVILESEVWKARENNDEGGNVATDDRFFVEVLLGASAYGGDQFFRVDYKRGTPSNITLPSNVLIHGQYPFQTNWWVLLCEGLIDGSRVGVDRQRDTVFITKSEESTGTARAYGRPDDAIIRVHFVSGKVFGKMYWKELKGESYWKGLSYEKPSSSPQKGTAKTPTH